MPAKSRPIDLTPRDYQLLQVFLRGPHTAQQLRRCSLRFDRPFANDSLLLRRLRRLRQSGLVQSWPYASMVGEGTLYFKLSRVGYRLVMSESPLPSDAFFREVPLGNQHHTFALHDVLSRIDAAAFEAGYSLPAIRRDREVCLQTDDHQVWPDATVSLQKDDQLLHFFVEIDCGTEPILSFKNRASLSRQVLAYDAYATTCLHRFRVLTLFTEGALRLSSYLDMAGELMHMSKRRSLFYAATTRQLSEATNVVLDPIFVDNRRQSQAMIPQSQPAPLQKKSNTMAPALAFC